MLGGEATKTSKIHSLLEPASNSPSNYYTTLEQGHLEKFNKVDKTALGSRGQTETYLKIDDLMFN